MDGAITKSMERLTVSHVMVLFAKILGPLYPDDPDPKKRNLAERICRKAEEVAGLTAAGQDHFISEIRLFYAAMKKMKDEGADPASPHISSQFREMLKVLLATESEYDRNFSVERMVSQAQLLWSKLQLQGGLSDKELQTALANGIDPDRSVSDSEMSMIFFSARWADQGFPVVKASPRFVAAALVTQASQELLASIEAPWRAFAIALPRSPELLFLTDADGQIHSVSHVLVYRADNPTHPGSDWSYFVASRDSADCLWRVRIPNTLLCDSGSSLPDDNPLSPLGSTDETALFLAGRLIVSVTSAMTHREMVSEVDREAHSRYTKRGKGRAFAQPAEPRVWQITAPIEIDLTERVRQFQLGEEVQDAPHRQGKPLTLQSVVAGHWKMQPCGPRHSQRKSMWIQPYWRGPEDAPIAVRPHVVEGVSNRVWRS